MFEQTFVTNKGPRRRWAYVLGLAGELLGIGVLLLLPLIYTERMTNFGYSHLPMIAPHDRSPKPPPADTKAYHGKPRFAPKFVAIIYTPREIPPTPLMIVETVDTAPNAFVPGAVPGNNLGLRGIPTGVEIVPPPPPPPQPKPVDHPPAPKPKQEPIRQGGDVQAAKIIRRVIPVYPQLARAARVQGTVQLVGVIAKDGTIIKLQVISGHPLLIAAAVDAVRQWTYRPTLLNGEPVEVVAPIDVHFTLAQ